MLWLSCRVLADLFWEPWPGRQGVAPSPPSHSMHLHESQGVALGLSPNRASTRPHFSIFASVLPCISLPASVHLCSPPTHPPPRPSPSVLPELTPAAVHSRPHSFSSLLRSLHGGGGHVLVPTPACITVAAAGGLGTLLPNIVPQSSAALVPFLTSPWLVQPHTGHPLPPHSATKPGWPHGLCAPWPSPPSMSLLPACLDCAASCPLLLQAHSTAFPPGLPSSPSSQWRPYFFFPSSPW